MVAQALPHARREDRSEVAVHRGPGRECRRGRQVPPLAARAYEVEQSVEQAAHLGCSWPPSGLSGRDERLQQPVLVVAQRLAGAKIPNQNTICRRPHHGLPEESPRNGVTTAAHTSSPDPYNLSKRAVSSSLAILPVGVGVVSLGWRSRFDP